MYSAQYSSFVRLACSRLWDGGGKSFSKKTCEKRAGAGETGRLSPIFPAATATAPFPKSCASYFRFARLNTFPLYYLRAWHKLCKTDDLFTSLVAKTSAPGFHFNVALARRRARQTIKIKRALITITPLGQEIFKKFKAQIHLKLCDVASSVNTTRHKIIWLM